MTARLRIVLILAAALVIPSSLALASSAPAAPPAAAAVLPPLGLLTVAPVCPRADLPAFLPPTALPLAIDICGACSDASCLGEPINFACKPGFRCIPGPACSTTGATCRCLPID